MMKFVLNNFKKFLKEEKIFLVLLAFLQVTSVIIILSAYGIINHFNTKVEEVEGTTLDFDFSIIRDDYYKAEELYRFCDMVIPKLEKKLDRVSIMGFVGESKAISSADYRNGKYVVTEAYKDNFFPIWEGQVFTDEMYNNKTNCVIVPSDMANSPQLKFENEVYDIIGHYDDSANREILYFPFQSLPKSGDYVNIGIYLNKPLTQSEYDMIYQGWELFLSDKTVIPEFDGIANENDYRVYRSVIFCMLILILLCALNYCVIYQYLLEKNKKSFAIIRMCGCTKTRATIGYLVEMISESIVLMLAGIALFANVIYHKLGEIFEYMEFYYSINTYCVFAGIYIGMLVIIYMVQILRFVSVTPVKLIKEV